MKQPLKFKQAKIDAAPPETITACVNLIVNPTGRALWNNTSYRCTLGSGGVSFRKEEGDGVTPAGVFELRRVYFRSDRLDAPRTRLPVAALRPTDAWCDCPEHKNYNQHVTLPFDGHHELLWRDDNIYDLIVVISHNDQPVLQGKGSAIFIHVATPDYKDTKGCVAFSQTHLLKILEQWSIDCRLEIRP